jgi:predicted RNase H-like nuclease (RuvC/YqgF family)
LQQGLRHAKASLSGAKTEVKQYKKHYDQAARQVLVLKTALGSARAETKDHCCIAVELQTSLVEIAGLKADLSKEQHTMKQLTDQFNAKAKEYDILGLYLVATITNYRDALLELKATKEDIAKLSIDLIVTRNLVSENALFAEHVKEELYVTATDLMAVNEETAILKGMSRLTKMQATLDDDKYQKK